MIFLVSLVFTAVIVLELSHLIKGKLWRETAVFSGLMAIGMIYSYGYILDWEVPNLVQLIEVVFIPVTQFIERLIS